MIPKMKRRRLGQYCIEIKLNSLNLDLGLKKFRCVKTIVLVVAVKNGMNGTFQKKSLLTMQLFQYCVTLCTLEKSLQSAELENSFSFVSIH